MPCRRVRTTLGLVDINHNFLGADQWDEAILENNGPNILKIGINLVYFQFKAHPNQFKINVAHWEILVNNWELLFNCFLTVVNTMEWNRQNNVNLVISVWGGEFDAQGGADSPPASVERRPTDPQYVLLGPTAAELHGKCADFTVNCLLWTDVSVLMW